MSRFSPVSKSRVEAIGELMDISYTDTEFEKAAERVNTLREIFQDLESVPKGLAENRRRGSDTFEEPPRSPEESNDPYNSWVSRFDLVRNDARDDLLYGLNVGIKDNTCVAGVEMTVGSRAMEGFVPGENAEVVDRLLDSGARIVGKTNMDEFAFGPTSETSAFGATENPNAPGHVTGGSSSGSAAAVAAGDVDLSLGTDTGGSVRIPASYCGIVGIKPTFGTVPLHGVVELAPSLDHVGPLARDVETTARGLEVMRSTSPSEERLHENLGVPLEEVTIGVEDRFFEKHVADETESRVSEAIDALESEGAEVTDVSIPSLEYSRETWWGIAPAEFANSFATSGLGFGRRGKPLEGLAIGLARMKRADSKHLGQNIKEMLTLGAYLNVDQDGYHYARAQNIRATLTEQFTDALSDVDVIAAPATPTPALELGEFERGVTPPVNWNTHPTDLTGHPSISVPCGRTDDGLPIGLQLIGAWHEDDLILDIAHAYETTCA